MPTYDYQCEKCGFEFEREQRITEDPIKTCPKCKARKVKKLLSAPNFILKGGGWYADGYGSSGKKKGSESGASSSSASSSSDSSTTASKDTKSSGTDSTSKSSGGGEKSGTKASE